MFCSCLLHPGSSWICLNLRRSASMRSCNTSLDSIDHRHCNKSLSVVDALPSHFAWLELLYQSTCILTSILAQSLFIFLLDILLKVVEVCLCFSNDVSCLNWWSAIFVQTASVKLAEQSCLGNVSSSTMQLQLVYWRVWADEFDEENIQSLRRICRSREAESVVMEKRKAGKRVQ